MIKIKSINTDVFRESFFQQDSRAELICLRWFPDLLYALFCQLTPIAGTPLERIYNGNLVSGSYRSTLQSHGAWKKTRNTTQITGKWISSLCFLGAHCRVRRFPFCLIVSGARKVLLSEHRPVIWHPQEKKIFSVAGDDMYCGPGGRGGVEGGGRVGKFGKYFFRWLDLSRDFFGYSKQSEDSW